MKRVLLYQILVFITHGKTWKAHTITINLKYQRQHGMVFELLDESYPVSDIEGYFEYILKKQGQNMFKNICK